MKERREFRRSGCLLACRFSKGGSVFPGQVVDISYGGACVIASSGLPIVGTQMNLTFEETDRSLRGQVVYRRLQSDHPKQLDHFGLMFLESWDFRVKALTPVLEKCSDHRG